MTLKVSIRIWETMSNPANHAIVCACFRHPQSAIDQISNSASESVPNPELETIHNQLIQVAFECASPPLTWDRGASHNELGEQGVSGGRVVVVYNLIRRA